MRSCFANLRTFVSGHRSSMRPKDMTAAHERARREEPAVRERPVGQVSVQGGGKHGLQTILWHETWENHTRGHARPPTPLHPRACSTSRSTRGGSCCMRPRKRMRGCVAPRLSRPPDRSNSNLRGRGRAARNADGHRIARVPMEVSFCRNRNLSPPFLISSLLMSSAHDADG